MSFSSPQNPGIGGLDELTLAEEQAIQVIAALGTAGQVLKTNATEDGLEWGTVGGGTGDVVGPATSTDNAIARFDGATGKLVQNSGVTIDDNDDLLMGTDNRIKLNTSLPTLTTEGLIQLKFNDDEAKAIIAYVDKNDEEVIWLQAHDYLVYPGNRHKHFSIEASDAAGLKQTRFSVSYGADINVVNVNAADFYVAGTGGIRTIDSDFDGVLKLTPATTFDIYPQGQATRALRINDNGTNIEITGLGVSVIKILDAIAVSGAITPESNNTYALGDVTKMWADLFIGSGGVINFNNGDATLTHSAGLLTSNVPLSLGTTNALTAGTIELGHASDTTISRVSAGVVAVEGVNLVKAGSITTDGITMNTSRVLGRTTASAGAVEELSSVDAFVSAASDTTAGKVELAIASEVNTGTDATRAVTPDALAGSNFGIRYLQMVVFDFGTDVATGDGKFYAVIPPALNGMNLISTNAKVITAGTTGTMDIQIHNVTDAVDMLSTKMTIDSTETSTDTAATAAVIDTTKDDVATGDILRVDVDAVQTTKAKGLIVTLGFQLP